MGDLQIEAVRGMRDVLPPEYHLQAEAVSRITRVLSSYGYQRIDLPIIEHRDLYLRKLGEELVGKVYEFSFNRRDLVLRPEWTASVLRSYVTNMQEQPLPLRVQYAGPVFRNERPQRHTYRQFTQIGSELIGAPPPRADAECLALACAGLQAAGVEDFRVRIGHIGLIRQALASFNLSERVQSILAWNLERMRKHGPDSIREQLATIEGQGDLPIDPALIDGLDDQQAEALLLHALRTIGVNLRFGTRPPEAIVGRLVRKLRRPSQIGQIERAIELLHRISQIQGPADQALPAATALLQQYQLSSEAIAELEAIVRLAEAHGVAHHRLMIDLGLGRGLNYYTGIIFEIYSTDEAIQLCGGGRYDDLVTTLGGRQATPAIGFAYGMERVVAAAQLAPPAMPTGILVAATEEASYPYAIQVAQTLRNRGWVTAVDVRGRSSSINQRDADRRGLHAIVFVGPQEQAAQQVLWRELRTRSDRTFDLQDLPRYGSNA